MIRRSVWLAFLLGSGACSLLSPPPPLLPSSTAVARHDFEEDLLNEPPRGLEPGSAGRWAVADSPTAASGHQVVVHRGDSPSRLSVTAASRAERIEGEVSLRVLLGPSGAGIACEGDDAGGFVVKADPGESRVGLYRRSDGSVRLVASEKASIRKGEWVRLGIVCEPELVIGYLDGKAVLREAGRLGRLDLALYADGGVTAQFDDLRYAAKDGPVEEE